jgi:hypothetical protein
MSERHSQLGRGEQEEERPLHAAHLHQPKNPVVVDPAEMVDDRPCVVDHGRAALPTEGDGPQAGRGAAGTEKPAARREGHADRGAPGEGRRPQSDAQRHERGVERDDGARACSEQQRMDMVGALERLSIPCMRFQHAIQRMSRRQPGATPSPDHRLRLQACQAVEAGKRVGAIGVTGRPILEPSGSRDGWHGRHHPAFTTTIGQW